MTTKNEKKKGCHVMNCFITYLSMFRVRYGHCQHNSTEIFLRREYSSICQNSSDSVPTSYLVCFTMASILNSKLRDLKHGLPLATIVKSPFFRLNL